MPRVVLDKSALFAAPGEMLAQATKEMEFLLIHPLCYELGTDRQGKANTLIAKARRSVGDKCLPPNAMIIDHELQEGTSGADFLSTSAPRFRLSETAVGDHGELQSFEDEAGWSGSVNPIDEELSVIVKEMADLQQLMAYVEAEVVADPEIVVRARGFWQDFANRHGMTVSPGFRPGPGWLTYGSQLAKDAFWTWKVWKSTRREGVGGAVNTTLDTEYVAYMAIADGVLSSETNFLLPFAWACWPSKREHIYLYSQERRKIERYVPGWER